MKNQFYLKCLQKLSLTSAIFSNEISLFFGNSILKPIIPVEIFTPSFSIRYVALIDSGADFCIFDGEIAESLGIKVESGTLITFGGIQEKGGQGPIYTKLHFLLVGIEMK